MLVYTKTKILLSSLLVLSVAANIWFVWDYWIDVPAAERAKFDYLFPGFRTDETDGVDVSSTLRFSYVFVHPAGAGYELALVDRQDCSFFTTFPMTKEQLVEPSLYAFKPILVDQYSFNNEKITLLAVREDTFASQHIEDLQAACPEVKRIMTDRQE